MHWSLNNTLQTYTRGEGTPEKLSRQSLLRPKPTKKGYGGTGIRARVKRITTAYANHYTIPPRWDISGVVEINTMGLLAMGGPQVEMAWLLDEGPPHSAIQLL